MDSISAQIDSELPNGSCAHCRRVFCVWDYRKSVMDVLNFQNEISRDGDLLRLTAVDVLSRIGFGCSPYVNIMQDFEEIGDPVSLTLCICGSCEHLLCNFYISRGKFMNAPNSLFVKLHTGLEKPTLCLDTSTQTVYDEDQENKIPTASKNVESQTEAEIWSHPPTATLKENDIITGCTCTCVKHTESWKNRSHGSIQPEELKRVRSKKVKLMQTFLFDHSGLSSSSEDVANRNEERRRPSGAKNPTLMSMPSGIFSQIGAETEMCSANPESSEIKIEVELAEDENSECQADWMLEESPTQILEMSLQSNTDTRNSPRLKRKVAHAQVCNQNAHAGLDARMESDSSQSRDDSDDSYSESEDVSKQNEYYSPGKKLKTKKPSTRPAKAKIRYTCPEPMCNGKTFCSKVNLQRHVNAHLPLDQQERRFPCNLCEKRFTDKHALKLHIRVHTGEKNFLCPLCGMSFRQPSHLRTHMLQHPNADEFMPNLNCHKCQDCGKSFSTPTHLFEHSLSHSEDRPNICDVCGKGFKLLKALNFHKLHHDNRRDYKCMAPSCLAAFNYKKALTSHLENVHGVNKEDLKIWIRDSRHVLFQSQNIY